MAIFISNLKKIENQNLLFNQKKSTYKLAVNKFSDLTRIEFLKQRTGALAPALTVKPNSITTTTKLTSTSNNSTSISKAKWIGWIYFMI